MTPVEDGTFGVQGTSGGVRSSEMKWNDQVNAHRRNSRAREEEQEVGQPPDPKEGLLCLQIASVRAIAAFLNMRDLGRADSAFTNMTLRPRWLRSLRGMKSLALSTCQYTNADEFRTLRWVVHKEIVLDDLNLSIVKRSWTDTNAVKDDERFDWCCRNGHGDVASLMVRSRLVQHDHLWSGRKPLYSAARFGCVDAVKALVTVGADLDATSIAADGKQTTALFAAAGEGHIGVLKVLLEAGAFPECSREDGGTPLHIACQRGHSLCVAALLNAGVNATCTFERCDFGTETLTSAALHVAAQKGHVNIVKMLCDHVYMLEDAGLVPTGFLKKWVNASHPCPPLYLACQQGASLCAQILLHYGADINACAPAAFGGGTPLYIAVQKNRSRLVKHLLDSGADPNKANALGATPLMIAASTGRANVCKMLVDNYACPKIKAKGGINPLLLAAQHGHLDVIKLIDTAAFGIFQSDCLTDDMTPLIAACLTGHFEVVEWLINHGHSVFTRNKAGLSPAFAAKKGGNTKIVQLIKDMCKL